MAIFLSVLKIIGIVLLSILGLLVLVLLIALFVPVRYKLKADYDSDILADARISYLLHIISVRFLYNGESKLTIRLFGIPLRLPTKKKEEEPKTKEPMEATEEVAEVKEEEPKKDKKKILDDITYYIDVLNSDSTRKAWNTCKKRLGKLLKHIVPRKCNIDVTYGLNDPYYTGIIIGAYNVFYEYLGKVIKLTPLYDHQEIIAHAKLKGHIRLAPLAGQVLLVFLDKNCRRFIKAVRRKS